LLPEPLTGEEAHDPAVNPLKTRYKPYLEEALRVWQDDLKNGKETKKWREEALQAGRDRIVGRFDEWKEAQREEYWGKGDEEGENEEPQSVVAQAEVDVAVEDRQTETAKPEQ